MKRIILISFFLLVSCSLLDSDNSADRMELKRSWEVVEFVDSGGNEIPFADDELLTIRFSDDSSLGGDAGCNVYGGDYIARENGEIRINNLISTEIACEQPTYGDDFIDSLSRVSAFELENGRLILHFNGNGKLIFLERVE